MEQASAEHETEGRKDNEVVRIKVNEHEVIMPTRKSTGLGIKEAAIAQGVQIRPNFILELERKHEKNKIIGDDEPVELHEGMSFTAIRNDDNS